MTDIATIENKLSAVVKYLKILRTYRKFSIKQIVDDLTIKGAIERYLYLVIQATIELAEALVSYKGMRKPSSYRESFEILQEEKLISAKLCQNLVKMTGFRNIIAHDYEKVNFAVVYDVLENRLKDIQNFIKEIKKKLRIR